jgi:hypothetical protein
MVDKYDLLGTIWTISGFLGIIGLGFLYHSEERVWSWQVIALLLFTVASFVMALHFTMHDYTKERKKDEQK